MDLFISKPFKLSELQLLINHLLSENRPRPMLSDDEYVNQSSLIQQSD
jgi:DNA-binding response OmpR family regulator